MDAQAALFHQELGVIKLWKEQMMERLERMRQLNEELLGNLALDLQIRAGKFNRENGKDNFPPPPDPPINPPPTPIDEQGSET